MRDTAKNMEGVFIQVNNTILPKGSFKCHALYIFLNINFIGKMEGLLSTR